VITLHCCGQDYYADEVHLGRKIKCVKCGRILLIERPASTREAKVRETFTVVSPASRNVPSKRLLRYVVGAIAFSLLVLGFLVYRDYISAPVQKRGEAEAPPPGSHPPLSPANRSLTETSAPVAVQSRAKEELRPPGVPLTSTATAESRPGTSAPLPAAMSPAQAREREILEQDAGKLGDPELGEEYQEINEQHFRNRLPKIPVIWESRLSEIGPLVAEGFTEEGMACVFGDKLFILLNPQLRLDRRKRTGVLCHEMVHVHLFSIGDTKTKHGPAFQNVLHRLSAEGAFEGDWASQSEKLGLRSWLDRESARLEGEDSELERNRDDINHEGSNLDEAVRELNERISRANEQGFGWPSEDEIESFKSARDLFNQRAIDFNARVERHNADCTRFNRQANHYNLIMSYPDGLDEESLIPPKSGAGRYTIPQ